MKFSVYLAQIKDLPAEFAALSGQLDKVQVELLAKIGDLQTQITNLEGQLADVDVPADAEATLDQIKGLTGEVKGKVQAMDDWNPDQPA